MAISIHECLEEICMYSDRKEQIVMSKLYANMNTIPFVVIPNERHLW